MRVVEKTLSFPLAGVSRARAYREQMSPYSAPWAVNVRGVGAIERRLRGGSRPGLVKTDTSVTPHQFGNGTAISSIIPLTYVDGTGARKEQLIVLVAGAASVVQGHTSVVTIDASLLTPTGIEILTDDGSTILFPSTINLTHPSANANFITFEGAEFNGKLVIADTVLKQYDPLTGIVDTVTAKYDASAVPAGNPLICVYRGRVILAGEDHVYYACRQGDITDWNFGADMNDVGRAVAGELSKAGKVGPTPTALIPFGDQALFFAAANELWLLKGDPVTGTAVQVSDGIGVLAPGAWAASPEGLVMFLSADGLYTMGMGSPEHPRRFSEDAVPEELRDIDPTTNAICMAYDGHSRGFHLFVTPEAYSDHYGSHWWIDVANKAMWPVHLQYGHQPTAVSRIQGTTGRLKEVVLGCVDGYLRKFSDSATTDDGTAIESHVLLGPFRLATNDTTDAILNELHGILADNSGTVTWRIVTASSAEEAADIAADGVEDALAGTTISGVAASGTWSGLRNKVDRPRVRGAWAVVWLSSSVPWAYEAVAARINQLGRLR